MKKRRNKFLDIRVQFFFICMAGFIGVALLAALAAWGLEHLGVNVPMFVWLLIFTLLLGSATAAGFSIAFFAPISRLSRAMKEVAGGNFRVHVETKSVFRDIRDSFDSFNLMVSELNATETLQTDFISNVSHEFKTPISAIEGYASLLQEHQQSPEEQASTRFSSIRAGFPPSRATFCCFLSSTASPSTPSARASALMSR